MKIIHLSDLHIGKRINDYSLLPDQSYILDRIFDIVSDESPEAVIIAGDVYDKSVPSAEAVELFDSFLTRLYQNGINVFAISGNHDSPERIAFATSIMKSSNIYLSPIFDGSIIPVTLKDDFGEVNFYMLPFIKPSVARAKLNDENISNYTDALRAVIDSCKIDKSKRNIFICHQFVTGAVLSESEDITVGGLDNVDISVFDGIDYVALGHIHRPQKLIRETVRYCGTPLKYSFSEVGQDKSVTVLKLQKKGDLEIKTVPLTPLHDMRKIKGSYMQLCNLDTYKNTKTDDYLQVTLTDEEEILDAVSKLRTIYPNIMELVYDNKRTRSYSEVMTGKIKSKTPLELFSELYLLQNNSEMSKEQEKIVSEIIEKVGEEDE